MNPQIMNIVIAVNKSYIPYAYVMLTSLLHNNPRPINVYVLHRELLPSDEELLQQLCTAYPVHFQYIYIPDTALPPAEVLAATSWGIETYFRLSIIDLLPLEVDRVLYLDSDMIVNKSIDDLYFLDLGTKKIAATNDLYSKAPFGDYRDDTFRSLLEKDFTYFNAGLMLLDLSALRADYCFETYMNIARELNYQIQFPDQDLLNYCHHGEVLYLDFKKYNLFARRAYINDRMHYEDVKTCTSIIHYTNSKPWQGNCLHCDIEQLWWDYAKMTPFYYDLLQKITYEIMMDSTLSNYFSNLQSEHRQLLEVVTQYETILKAAGIPF